MSKLVSRTGLIVVTVIAMVFAVVALTRSSDGVSERTPRPATVDSRSSAGPLRPALFVGDSFTAGAGISPSDRPYPYAVGEQLGWTVSLDAQGGTGFIADGRGTGNGDTSQLIDRLGSDSKFGPIDYVVIDAGRNDLSQSTDALTEAVSEYLIAVDKIWPEAELFVIMPTFMKKQEYDNYGDLLESIESVANSAGGKVLDPYAEGWYESADLDSMLADQVHPNSAGNTYIGDRITEWLRKNLET